MVGTVLTVSLKYYAGPSPELWHLIPCFSSHVSLSDQKLPTLPPAWRFCNSRERCYVGDWRRHCHCFRPSLKQTHVLRTYVHGTYWNLSIACLRLFDKHGLQRGLRSGQEHKRKGIVTDFACWTTHTWWKHVTAWSLMACEMLKKTCFKRAHHVEPERVESHVDRAEREQPCWCSLHERESSSCFLLLFPCP